MPRDVAKALAHRAQAAQVMVLTEQLVNAGNLGGVGQFNANLVQKLLLDLIGQSFCFLHARC
jgi:hypothetical protein